MIKTSEAYRMDSEHLYALLMSDELFRDRIRAGISNFKNSVHDDVADKFSGWNYETFLKFQDRERNTMLEWSGKYLEQQMKVESSAEYIKNSGGGTADTDYEYENFVRGIPDIYRNADISVYKDQGEKLVKNIFSGCSYILMGGNGVGKTYLGWAVSKEFKKRRENFSFRSLYEIMQDINQATYAGKNTAEYISERYVYGYDILLVDESDKISPTDANYNNLSYLIDKRYERLRQTLMLANSVSMSDLTNKLGSSIVSRFQSKQWRAQVLKLSGDDKRTTLNVEQEEKIA